MKTKWIVIGLLLAGLVGWFALRGCDPGPSTPDVKPTASTSDAATTPAASSMVAAKNECNIQTAPLNDPASVHCPQNSGFTKCGHGTKCCPAAANACVPTSEMCSTGKTGFECFSNAQCDTGRVCCAFAQKTASMFQPCTKPQLTFDGSESSHCVTLAECPKDNARKARLCPKLGTSEGCDPSETCKERFTYLQGILMTIYVCE